ncbi:enoyl-CoA delta isomerase 2-like [Macrosteles quadrilineatus]|uniref:enoyl-CoA delta isomerase 2-like n=1 Tax=Macrosteles quadrilineatus TaxID=74068 RepID=UPI0023E1B457|nr:enoyl-CoA delta isomerase 2-like [Macrosteles quadrilineatus]
MDDLHVYLCDGVLTVAMNRPSKQNGITLEMMLKMINSLIIAGQDNNVKAVVLRGVGDFFSSGFDFNSFFYPGFDTLEQAVFEFRNFVAALIDFPKMLVAVVNGPAIGMGCTILALCDFVYASDDVYFHTPFSMLGLVAEGCSTYTFPKVFGAAKAARLLYLSESMSVQEAAHHGFVTCVFPKEEMEEHVQQKLNHLVSLPIESLIQTKKLIRKWENTNLHCANDEEVEALIERFNSDDFFSAFAKTTKIKNKL